MREIERLCRVINEVQRITLMKAPTGVYVFSGFHIPVQLTFVNKDGSELSDEEATAVARANIPAMLAKSRSYKSIKDAMKDAKKYGYKESEVAVSDF